MFQERLLATLLLAFMLATLSVDSTDVVFQFGREGTGTDSPSRLPYTVKVEDSLARDLYDGIIVIIEPGNGEHHELLRDVFASVAQIDKAFDSDVIVIPTDLPAGRIISSPTVPFDDYVDVRALSDAAKKGIARALRAGVKSPLLFLPSLPRFKNSELVTLLGALEALYVNLQLREDNPERVPDVQELGVYSANPEELPGIIELATAIERGRIVARDIAGADPERMAPPRVQDYITEVFLNTDIKVEVTSDPKILEEEYPLFYAVERAARNIERHRGRIIYLTYEPADQVVKTLYLVGKGVTYDTGGADLKTGGAMVGMSRDKAGAAAIAGFMQVLAILKPNGIKVIGALPMVRNSIGADAYVSDEVIVSRNKLRVRIGNTDAEGRMIMGDVLCEMRELAENAPDPHLVTIATLTGHARRTVGPGYSIVLDNGPAKKVSIAQKLQAAGEELGDMFEISVIRREDVAFNKGRGMGDDVLQANNVPSAQSSRGHQSPTTFLMMVSGIDKHGTESNLPLKYTHIDIAASAGEPPLDATSAPLVGLVAHYLIPDSD